MFCCNCKIKYICWACRKKPLNSLYLFLILGRVRNLSTSLWSLTHLTALHLNDNYLTRIPPDIAKLHNLLYLDLSSNKLRSLPAELGNMVSLRWVEFSSAVISKRVFASVVLATVLMQEFLYFSFYIIFGWSSNILKFMLLGIIWSRALGKEE